MNKSALPYSQGGKRIIFGGAENFGPGSFCPVSRMHVFSITGGKIIPCKMISIAKDEISTRKAETIKYHGIKISIFEN